MTTSAIASPPNAAAPRSPATDRREEAEALGRRLAEEVGDPDALAEELRAGLRALSDPAYLEGQRRVAPGIGALHGVRWPLVDAIKRGFRTATKGDRPTPLLLVAARLFDETELEPRWFAFGILERLVVDDPERTWQLIRRAAQEAADWITVDSLAHPAAKGIAAEPYRWAELEQLVYSPNRWERRLVGSTVATMTHVDRRRGREPLVAERGLALAGDLIGDAEPDVQKALSWALRSLTVVDLAAVTAFLEREAETAATTADGYRAWVVRDTLPKLPAADAQRIRERLASVRRRAGSPSTSRASRTADRFRSMGLGRDMPRPPLT